MRVAGSVEETRGMAPFHAPASRHGLPSAGGATSLVEMSEWAADTVWGQLAGLEISAKHAMTQGTSLKDSMRISGTVWWMHGRRWPRP